MPMILRIQRQSKLDFFIAEPNEVNNKTREVQASVISPANRIQKRYMADMVFSVADTVVADIVVSRLLPIRKSVPISTF